MISKRSPEYMFGQIMARLEEGDKTIAGMKKSVDEITSQVAKLPCSDRARDIKELKDWKLSKNGMKQHSADMTLKLKHGLVIGVFSALAAALFAAGFSWMFASLGDRL